MPEPTDAVLHGTTRALSPGIRVLVPRAAIWLLTRLLPSLPRTRAGLASRRDPADANTD